MYSFFLSVVLCTSTFPAFSASLSVDPAASLTDNDISKNAEEILSVVVSTETQPTGEEAPQAPALAPLTTQHFGPSLFFQRVPTKRFLVITELSNFLNISVPDHSGELTTYNIVVAKLFQKSIIPNPKTGKIGSPIYIAFIAPLYTSEWEIFTGFDDLSGAPYTLNHRDNLHLLLAMALSEMVFYMPQLGKPDVFPKKICDISRMYPDKWHNFLTEILGVSQNPLSTTYDQLVTTINKVFEDVPTEEDKCTNICASLAQLQPFKVSLKTHNICLAKKTGPVPFIDQLEEYTRHRLYFSSVEDTGKSYKKIELPKNAECATIKGIAAALKKSIDDEIKAKKNPVVEFFDPMVFSRLHQFKKHERAEITGGQVSLFTLKQFITKVASHVTTQQKDSQNELGAIDYLQKLITSDEESNPAKKSALKLIDRLQKAIDVHLRKTDFFSLPDDFGNVITTFSTQEMNALFQQQNSFTDFSKTKPQNFEIQLSFLLHNLDLFSRLHVDMVALGKSFERYYEGIGRKERQKVIDEKITSSAENQAEGDFDRNLVLERRKINILVMQPEEEVNQLYIEFERLVNAIRKIYSNFGYLPVCLIEQDIKKAENTDFLNQPADIPSTVLLKEHPEELSTSPQTVKTDTQKSAEEKNTSNTFSRTGLPSRFLKSSKPDATTKNPRSA